MENKTKEIQLSDIKLDTSSQFRGSIIIDGKRYIVKKELPLSEHITSHLMGLIGIPVQNTSLALLDGELVVLCEDFTPKDMEFVASFRLFKELFPDENIEEIYDPAHLKKVFEKYLRDRAEEALSLVIYKSAFDCIVKQEDFGSGNWGIFQGKDPLLAPFYDNARSMTELMNAINNGPLSLGKAIYYAMEEYQAPFISFRDRCFVAKEGFEDVTNEAIERFRKAYTVESFCSFVKDTIIDTSQYIDIREEVKMFLYAALVFRYLHVIEGLEKDELLEVADSLFSN